MKYLGVHFDPRLHFAEHARLAVNRATAAGKYLAHILPHLRGAKQKTRRVRATVVTSRLLYGAPIWSSTITSKARNTMEAAYRRIMLRVACCYRTTSYEAAAVVSSMPPLDLLAEERRSIFIGTDKGEVRKLLVINWQQKWDSSEKGRWKHRLIKDVGAWYQRNHGEVSFHVSQVLTGHGCFGNYLYKYCNLDTGVCAQCGATPDSLEHAVFKYDAWHQWRNEAGVYLEVEQITADNIVGIMLRSKASWKRVSSLLARIMITSVRRRGEYSGVAR